MSRRLIAIIVAALLAVVAASTVYVYVSTADRRAVSQMSPTHVLVVAEQVPAGTPGEALADYLKIEEIPAKAVVPERVTELAEVQGKVTTTILEPGEQLLAARFASPEEVAAAGEVEIPEGFHQLTVTLPSTRVLGGHLKAGDTVGFFVSGTAEGRTHLRLHKVLVTRVEGGVTTVTAEDGTETTQPAAEFLKVTLAASAPDAEVIVHAAEYYSIWLSLEPPEAPEEGDRIVTGKDMWP